ncbi:MAG: hypothetical protein PHS57_07220 [Alphaproteobacteria bacterium]|nr:hypothetical protein [Alphaproteobacteria bacterium]
MTIRSALTTILILTPFVLSFGPARAEQLVKMPPEMRLEPGLVDEGLSWRHVALDRIEAKDLPQNIMEPVRAELLMCFGLRDVFPFLGVYSWRSDRTREERLPPRYVVDYTAFASLSDRQRCRQKLCTKEGCQVRGYTPVGKERWQQDFEIVGARFFFSNDKDKQTGATMTTINLLAPSRADCKEIKGSVSSPTGCLRKFLWRPYGLSLLSQ